MECEEKQDPSIPHEWILDSRVEAVRLSNYLRQLKYEVVNEVRRPLGITLYYVGVPFSSIKKSID
jgi:hypothetical protein